MKKPIEIKEEKKTYIQDITAPVRLKSARQIKQFQNSLLNSYRAGFITENNIKVQINISNSILNIIEISEIETLLLKHEGLYGSK